MQSYLLCLSQLVYLLSFELQCHMAMSGFRLCVEEDDLEPLLLVDAFLGSGANFPAYSEKVRT